MMTATLLSPLLLALAAGIAAPAHAAGREPASLPPQTCQSIRHELDAVATHVSEARAERAGAATAPDPYLTLARALESHLDALHANLPAPATQRAQASVLVSDMRDALVLVRGATRPDARQLALQRLDADQRLYNRVLETLGCSATRPTAL
ncbi:MAG: hypothetical protein JNL37_01120 [Thauera sp.]|jgi:hypothetical protein|uniref:hypothetical protein n=1 Tax=unclassified Thauera TaxID=2609274 RepID=UPI001A560544|nr:hypothetical protein [Thauera sp.]MBL8463444.1 hypothetical protein [Thauera sp.]HRV79320.1 hypothetical protein [Thauera sp.]